MSQTHIIGRQFVELSIASDRDAFRLQEQFSQLLWPQVVNEISATLDLFSDPNITIRIDRIDIDIGRIGTSDSDRSLARQVREAVERELSHALKFIDQSSSSKRLLRDDRIISLWIHAMQHGYLPWWSSSASAADLDRQVEQILQSSESLPDELVLMLRSNALALRRVVSQNSTRLLKRLTHLLDKELATTCGPIFDAICSRLENRQGRRVRYEVSQRIFYKLALQESVFTEPSYTKTRVVDLLQSALKDLSEVVPVSLTDLTHDLRCLIEPTTSTSGVEQLPASYHQALEEVLDRIAGPNQRRLNMSSDASMSSSSIDTRASAADSSSSESGSPGEHSSQEKAKATQEGKLTDASRFVAQGTESPLSSSPTKNVVDELNIPMSQFKVYSEQQQRGAPLNEKDSMQLDLNTRLMELLSLEASSDSGPRSDEVTKLRDEPSMPRPRTGHSQSRETVTEIREGDTIYVEDAGAILLHPFLRTHFEALDLWRDGEFVDDRSREIAVHQIRYLTTTEEEAPEHSLVLPKILCGLAPDAPIERFVRLEDRNKVEADELLKAMIEHWGALKSTSPDGLRETFLRRDGALTYKSDGWRLQVESRSYDILLNRLPWPVSIINLPWMPEILHVEWI